MRTSVALLVLSGIISATKNSYDGYKVYRIHPQPEKLKVVANLRNTNYVDFWSPLRRDGQPVDVMVDPYAQEPFLKLLEDNAIKQEVLINNVATVIQEEQIKQSPPLPTIKGRISFTKYHTHGEIKAYVDQLAKDHSRIVALETIGKSYEGRDLKVIKISTDSNANKPIIFIDAGIHAREWIAPAVALYVINQLVEDPENMNLLEKVDWHVLPVVNPDGYEHTHDRKLNRLWRKTRSPGIICNGTDGNRNFDYHWAEVGSSNNECSDEYHGKHAFSESETIALSGHLLRYKANIKLYLSFHSFGKLILYPWGYTAELPENSDELQALGEAVARSIREVAGTSYTVGSSTNVLYEAAGGSDDWAKGAAGVELSYTIELPGGGWVGFDPPAKNILPTVTETWEGIKTYHHYIESKFQ